MLFALLMLFALFPGITRIDERMARAQRIILGKFSTRTREAAVRGGGWVSYRQFKCRAIWRGPRVSRDSLWFVEPGSFRYSNGSTVIISDGLKPPVVGKPYILLLSYRTVGPYAGRWMIEEKWTIDGNWAHSEGGLALGPEQASLADVESIARRSAIR